ncbi:hypothetical protein M427DRAFT_62544 [Gonapodya prolifera JEL478]|uniref:Uncharacterized protein n=1 Tax=Gonapodya prolifera (strain JEL478) TaxID=1344416 RepID=A0A139A0T4_GONPJ|nr:hypothetical protein M427DRAFT_62544 [Gonapodya prolifera JEL478]|eukprot:KXS10352.1 hypothetical protein M427DRAFT_62544 [Gonapodya prolifera JEL478]
MCIVTDFPEFGFPYTRLLPDGDRAHIRSLIFEDPGIQSDTIGAFFFDTPKAFPHLTELGVLTIFHGSKGWDHILPENLVPSTPSLLGMFHIDVYMMDLCEPFTSENIAQCVQELMNLLPHVQTSYSPLDSASWNPVQST